MADLCGVPNPDMPSTTCDLPANHGRVKNLWYMGQWFDHLSHADDARWVIPPNDERDEALVEAFAGAMAESVDFINLLTAALGAHGYGLVKLPAEPSNGAHVVNT